MNRRSVYHGTFLASGVILAALFSSPAQIYQHTMTIAETEPNNSPETAQSLGQLQRGITIVINGRAGTGDPGTQVKQVVDDCEERSPFQDFYTFTLPEAMDVGLSLTFDAAADLDLWLFYHKANPGPNDAVIKLVTASAATARGVAETIAPRALEAGTYYVAVNAPQFPRIPSSPYTLTLDVGKSATELHQLEDYLCHGDGFEEIGIFVNRFRPTRYPAELESVTYEFLKGHYTPSPVGKQVRLVGFIDPTGADEPPVNPAFTIDRRETIVRVGRTVHGRVKVTFDPPIRITQGYMYLGVEIAADARTTGVVLGVAKNIYGQRTYVSTDGGRTFRLASILPAEEPNPPEHTAIIRPEFRLIRLHEAASGHH
ncbi:MAG: PPC domain-containing protein [Blastocatellia bacterium]|nr:PPC domain-containing protein [Blastocatellia bacterium]MDW8241406.1 PPC domain-containing protein [Acidobacteriota bacterium]